MGSPIKLYFDTMSFGPIYKPSHLVYPPQFPQPAANMPSILNIQVSVSEIKVLCSELLMTVQNGSNWCKINQVLSLEEGESAWQTFTKDLMHCSGRIAGMQPADCVTSVVVNLEWIR